MGIVSSFAGRAFKAATGSFLGRIIKEEVLLMAAEDHVQKALKALKMARKGYEKDSFTQDFISKYKVGTPQCRAFIEKMQIEYDEAVDHYETLSAKAAGEETAMLKIEANDYDIAA